MIKRLLKIIEVLRLQIQIAQIRLQIKLFNEKLTTPNLKGIIRVIVHHGGGNLNFKEVNELHRKNWGFKSSLGYFIGYHKFIEFDGSLHIGRRDNEEGAHTVSKNYPPHYLNRTSVGICLQGNTEIKNKKSIEAQLKTLKSELDKYKAKGLLIKMHCDFFPTLCPGRYLKEWLRNMY
jgi:hypothetical protein